MLIQPQSKLLFIGDSITDCNRARPVGEGLFDALGNGYVNIINSLLTARYPAHYIRIVNMGVSGETMRDLRTRWQSDVMALQPNWLSICIGINDVWRHFHSPAQPEWHVPLTEYSQILEDLLLQTKSCLNGLVLMTPFFIEPNEDEPMRKMMDDYGSAVRRLADKYQAIFVDTQAAFDTVLKDLHPMALAWDRVHPTHVGHTILARAFLQAVEFQWQQE